MLDQQGLTHALILGQKTADCCGHFCMVGAQAEHGVYSVWHNGVGSSDTDHQRIFASVIHGYDAEKLGAHLGKWVTALHKRERRDLNVV